MNVAKSSSGGIGFVSDKSESGSLYPIHGVAIGANDITVGHKSGKRKLWTPEVLAEAASTLARKEIVVDHENRNSREVVGEIQDAKFKENVGVIYKGVIDDDELATKINHGWLEVSPRIIHSKKMEERDGLYVPKSVRKFDNLSIVVRGASPSNSVNLGEAEELMSVEELQSEFNSDDSVVEEYQDFEGQVNMRKYLFPTEEGALGAAQALGCSGSHTHEFEGETMYMPCDSHDQFLKSLSQTEEMQFASQMASQTKMTKKEALKFLSGLNPMKGTDARGMGEMLAKAMKADEMEKMMDEMSKHMDSKMGGGSGGSKKDSPLNRIS